mmetsp:Transcript_7481/g.13469  ORF Transcript_7481/g.13469 Transcript_7481/m.13469 type:complete len:252 (-) Transcript_7481:43-798(-)
MGGPFVTRLQTRVPLKSPIDGMTRRTWICKHLFAATPPPRSFTKNSSEIKPLPSFPFSGMMQKSVAFKKRIPGSFLENLYAGLCRSSRRAIALRGLRAAKSARRRSSSFRSKGSRSGPETCTYCNRTHFGEKYCPLFTSPSFWTFAEINSYRDPFSSTNESYGSSASSLFNGISTIFSRFSNINERIVSAGFELFDCSSRTFTIFLLPNFVPPLLLSGRRHSSPFFVSGVVVPAFGERVLLSIESVSPVEL